MRLHSQGDTVYFSELSPRPHDTGMVTMVSQNISEFALHVRAILGLTVPTIELRGPSASAVILGHGNSDSIQFSNVSEALQVPTSEIRLFGKPAIDGERRLGVALARGVTIEEARRRATKAAAAVTISY
jgi:phosphoribosylglycinamide formyltransferase 2